METILIISTVSALGIIIWLLIKTTGLKHKLNTAETEIKRFTLQEEHLIEENNSLSSKLDNISGSLNNLDRQIAIFKAKEEMDRNTIASMTESAKTMQERFDSAVDSISRLQTENTAMRTRLNFLESEKHKLEEETANRFKALATEILRQNTDTLKSQHESRLTELLSPLRENIEQFKKTFAESYEKESRERFALDKHIQELVALNQNIGKEAQELSRALRGNSKVQGDWGEMILEGILEKSGLEKGREFVIQESTVNEDGSRLRADVVVNYPDGRCAVIDSKVSLTDYVRSVNADCAEEQKTCLSAHAASVRKHIDELKNKNYQDYIGSRKADFVMMFIPNEGAYIAAMQTDNNLWQYAYDNRVIVISPTHLISVMKLLEQLWQHDRQSRNAVDIAKKAGAMYDKFVGFLTDLSKIRKALDSATLAYDESIKKLDTGKGSILRSAQSLKEMGAKASKSLPEQFDTE